LAVFGVVGLARMPLDIISAPAANVALPLGIDEMLHLGHRIRQVRRQGREAWDAWSGALAEMWWPILASMLIVASGFALFLLSDFPPTQRLGALVCVGALLTDLVVLLVLPTLASLGGHRRQSRARRTGRG
jgi:predicted RND superfamily exporter protein